MEKGTHLFGERNDFRRLRCFDRGRARSSGVFNALTGAGTVVHFFCFAFRDLPSHSELVEHVKDVRQRHQTYILL